MTRTQKEVKNFYKVEMSIYLKIFVYMNVYIRHVRRPTHTHLEFVTTEHYHQ